MKILNKKTLELLQADLLARQSELAAEIDAARQTDIATAKAKGIAATDVNDLKDQASNRERTTLLDAEVQRDRNELADVNAALARIADGTYGTCIDCAEPVDLQRLTAIPAAARCMECQTQFESRSA